MSENKNTDNWWYAWGGLVILGLGALLTVLIAAAVLNTGFHAFDGPCTQHSFWHFNKQEISGTISEADQPVVICFEGEEVPQGDSRG